MSLETIKAYLRKSRRRLETARKDFDEGFYESSLIRSYYCMYHAAKACLELQNSHPKTHEGLISEFGRLYITTGRINKQYGKTLSSAKRIREECEYEPLITIDKETAETKLTEARDFLETVEKLIKKLLRNRQKSNKTRGTKP